MKKQNIIIMDVVEDTVVDGPGFRTTVYAAGCRHHCPGCHNPESWNMQNGHEVGVDLLAHRLLEDPFADITFSGGDPLEQVEAFTELARMIKQGSHKTIWCYTGYRFEDICKSERLSQILPFLDVLVDGQFQQNLKDTSLMFRGSSNQRLIDVPASLQLGSTVSLDYNPVPHIF